MQKCINNIDVSEEHDVWQGSGHNRVENPKESQRDYPEITSCEQK